VLLSGSFHLFPSKKLLEMPLPEIQSNSMPAVQSVSLVVLRAAIYNHTTPYLSLKEAETAQIAGRGQRNWLVQIGTCSDNGNAYNLHFIINFLVFLHTDRLFFAATLFPLLQWPLPQSIGTTL